MSSSTHSTMHTHPDIMALRERYDQAAEKPTVQVADGVMMMAGLYAAGSAWIIGFADQALAVPNLIAGIAIALLAAAFGSAYGRTHAVSSAYGRTHGMSFIAPLLGVWMIVAPWVVADVTTSTAMIWSNVVVGALVFVLGMVAVATGTDMLKRSS
ncbi:MAG: SPW repeat protein [Rhodococcus sp. (in: high G+C Gram-positive bacteria)]